jgi:hypothetical protein
MRAYFSSHTAEVRCGFPVLDQHLKLDHNIFIMGGYPFLSKDVYLFLFACLKFSHAVAKVLFFITKTRLHGATVAHPTPDR